MSLLETDKNKYNINVFPKCNGNPPFYELEIDSGDYAPVLEKRRWSLLTRIRRGPKVDLVTLWKREKERIEEKKKT